MVSGNGQMAPRIRIARTSLYSKLESSENVFLYTEVLAPSSIAAVTHGV